MAIILFGESKASCCEHCKFYHSGRSICIINAKFIIDEYEEPEKCPVVEFSAPNGRLIDADAHIQSLKENQCGERCRKNHDCVNCGIGMYIRIVENEPTIIESEGKS